MADLQLFQFESQDVRIVTINGEPWFVAKDLCDVLGIKNSRDALSRLDDDEKDAVVLTDTIGRKQEMMAVSESGMYGLVLSSRKPEAKAFKKWVRSEILPSIRKTGSYSTQPRESYYFERLKQFLRDGKVPNGYFCIFRETLELVGDLEGKGCILPQSVTPDLSVGICWAKHLRSQGIEPKDVSKRYEHKFPNDPRGTVKPYAYLNRLLPEFRDWFYSKYQKDNLPKYLKGKYPDALPALSQLLGISEDIILKLK